MPTHFINYRFVCIDKIFRISTLRMVTFNVRMWIVQSGLAELETFSKNWYNLEKTTESGEN